MLFSFTPSFDMRFLKGVGSHKSWYFFSVFCRQVQVDLSTYVPYAEEYRNIPLFLSQFFYVYDFIQNQIWWECQNCT